MKTTIDTSQFIPVPQLPVYNHNVYTNGQMHIRESLMTAIGLVMMRLMRTIGLLEIWGALMATRYSIDLNK